MMSREAGRLIVFSRNGEDAERAAEAIARTVPDASLCMELSGRELSRFPAIRFYAEGESGSLSAGDLGECPETSDDENISLVDWGREFDETIDDRDVKQINDVIRDIPFTIRIESYLFDEMDWELSSFVLVGVHEPGMNIDEIRFHSDGSGEYEVSAGNLKGFCLYSDEEVADVDMPRDELREWFISAAEEYGRTHEIPMIEKIFGTPELFEKFFRNCRNATFFFNESNDWEDYLERPQ